MTNTLVEPEEKNYEYYDKGYGLRKHPRILSTLQIELTYTENQETLTFKCESKDISAQGMFLKFVAPHEELHSLVGKPVEMCLVNQKPISEKHIITGKFAWASKPVKNPADGHYYIFCGVQFDSELPLSVQLEQMAISAHNTLEKLVASYKKNLDKKLRDPLKQLSDVWVQIRSNISEIAFMDCVFWYYFAPQDVFIKNSMYLNQENSVLYRLKKDPNIRGNLMEHYIPILESELVKRVFLPEANEKILPHEERLLSEWLFPLFDNDEFLGLAQFKFQQEISHLFSIDKIFWFCAQIGNFISSIIESEEQKRDNNYTELLSHIIKLCKPQSEKREQYGFYEKIITKFSELMGEVPSFLYLFSEIFSAEELGEFANAVKLSAVKNVKDIHRINTPKVRIVGKDAPGCCPMSLLENHNPHFCEYNCSQDKRSRMYCIPLHSNNTEDASDQTQNELIATACFAVSQNFNPTKRLVRRINEVSRTSSLFIQLCLRLN